MQNSLLFPEACKHPQNFNWGWGSMKYYSEENWHTIGNQVFSCPMVSADWMSVINIAELSRNIQDTFKEENHKYQEIAVGVWVPSNKFKLQKAKHHIMNICRVFEKVSYSDRRSFQVENFHLSCCKSSQEPPELVKSQIPLARCLICSCYRWKWKQTKTKQTKKPTEHDISMHVIW